MKIEVFQSDKGDCLLISGRDGGRILADAGMRSSYSEHVAPALGRIAQSGGELDLVYVSHIDRDHIGGVLQLMEDHVAWRVRDFQRESGNDDFRDPPRPRPPKVQRLWHNAFHDVIADNAGPIEEMLAASAALLEAGEGDEQLIAETQRELATSVGDGIELSKRAREEQLGIPVNGEFGGKLAMVRGEPQTVELGSLKLTLLGPFKEDLDALRDDWNDWLRNNEDEVKRIRAEMAADTDRLVAGDVGGFRAAMALRARELGNRARVTVPNLASIMLLAEENGRTLLLTGDGHRDEIIKGLEKAGRVEGDGLHVDVLKVQHHGSEHNIDADFCRQVTADHYVFCANGEHENPDLAVVDAVVRSRRGSDRPFRLWFNSSQSASASARGREHMKEVEALVAQLVKASGRRMRATFLDRDSFVVK
jgi:beta-lactamase superfamily II metal-dependent hydrolase